LEVIREETTKNTTAATPIRFEDAVIRACKINPDVRVWRFRYWITHGEEERIRVVECEPELLLSYLQVMKSGLSYYSNKLVFSTILLYYDTYHQWYT
jgi:hypothetical protein